MLLQNIHPHRRNYQEGCNRSQCLTLEAQPSCCTAVLTRL